MEETTTAAYEPQFRVVESIPEIRRGRPSFAPGLIDQLMASPTRKGEVTLADKKSNLASRIKAEAMRRGLKIKTVVDKNRLVLYMEYLGELSEAEKPAPKPPRKPKASKKK